MDDLTVLKAIEEIKALKARYFRHIDLKEWDRYAELFSDDLIVYGENGDVTTEGGPAFAAAVKAFLDTSRTRHQSYMPEIEIIDETSARAVWPMHDIITWEQGDPRQGLRRMEGWGHYHETYRKEAGGWRIATMKLTRLQVDTE